MRRVKSPSGNAGFTLIEVLVAIVVMAIGLLGVASMQAMAKRGSFEALQRTRAAFLANDIIERMRTNPSVLDSYAAIVTGNEPVPIQNCGIDPQGVASPCTAAQLAVVDIFEWGQALTGGEALSGSKKVGGLVSPTGCIQSIAGTVTVIIAWRGLATSRDPAVGKGDFFTLCGTAGEHRRQLVVTTFIN